MKKVLEMYLSHPEKMMIFEHMADKNVISIHDKEYNQAIS